MKIRSENSVDALMAQFSPGAMVTIEWVSSVSGYDPVDEGWELEKPEAALIVRCLPSMLFALGHIRQDAGSCLSSAFIGVCSVQAPPTRVV